MRARDGKRGRALRSPGGSDPADARPARASSTREGIEQMTGGPYYRSALARIHHEAFGFHGDACAPGILARLAPIRERGGAVLELGCGSGALTRHLVAAGHRVIATDASPAMVALAREAVPGAEEVRRLTLPHDPLPEADAVVAVGHVLSYLPDRPLRGARIAGHRPRSAPRRRAGRGSARPWLSRGAGRSGPGGDGHERVGGVRRGGVPRPRDLRIRDITTFVRGSGRYLAT